MGRKTLCVIGSRPQYFKISRLWADVIVDTGQHYDREMVQGLKPDYNLKTTDLGQMIDKLVPVIQKEKPTQIVVIGDTRSTLAGATVAKYLGLPLIHIEAGMRSGEDMTEEHIRKVVDKMSDFHLATTDYCQKNLERESIYNSVLISDPEFEAMYSLFPTSEKTGTDKDGKPIYTLKSDWENQYKKPYCLLTLHRHQLLTDKKALAEVFKALGQLDKWFIFPCHPHTRKQLQAFGIDIPATVKLIKPVKHKELIRLVLHAEKVVTDSGGVQREAYWLMKDVIILRNNTEHYEIIRQGCGELVGHDPAKLKEAILNFNGLKTPIVPAPDAHERIKATLEEIASLPDAY